MKTRFVLTVLLAVAALTACSLAPEQPVQQEVVSTDAPPAAPTATPIPPTPTLEPTAIPPTPTLEPTPIPPTPEPVEEAAESEGAKEDAAETTDEAVEEATEEAAQPEAEAVEVASGSPALGRRLYATDFREGWPELEYDEGSLKPAPGGYLMEMQKQFGLWSFTTTLDLEVFYAEVIVSPQSCPAGRTAYGLLFQYQDDSHLRYFVVTCDGEFHVVDRNLPGGSVLLTGQVPDNVDPTTGSHSLGVLVSTDAIQAFINGQSVGAASIEELDPMTGDIGIFAESGDLEFSVLFERLEVYEAD